MLKIQFAVCKLIPSLKKPRLCQFGKHFWPIMLHRCNFQVEVRDGVNSIVAVIRQTSKGDVYKLYKITARVHFHDECRKSAIAAGIWSQTGLQLSKWCFVVVRCATRKLPHLLTTGDM